MDLMDRSATTFLLLAKASSASTTFLRSYRATCKVWDVCVAHRWHWQRPSTKHVCVTQVALLNQVEENSNAFSRPLPPPSCTPTGRRAKCGAIKLKWRIAMRSPQGHFHHLLARSCTRRRAACRVAWYSLRGQSEQCVLLKASSASTTCLRSYRV